MKKEELISNMTYLVNKYAPQRVELIELLKQDTDSVKYVLAEIDKEKIIPYQSNDIALIQDIFFYYC